jgi:hypothetical protein
MGDGYNFKQLQKHVLSLSSATDWETARKEWSFIDVIEADEPETCPCGHFPIVEICQIHNRITNSSTEVGNRCVRSFLGFRSDLVFRAIKSVRRDISKSLNADAIAFFHGRGVLNGWEYDFLQDTMRKRNLSAAQSVKRKSINEKVLAAVSRRGFRGPD